MVQRGRATLPSKSEVRPRSSDLVSSHELQSGFKLSRERPQLTGETVVAQSRETHPGASP